MDVLLGVGGPIWGESISRGQARNKVEVLLKDHMHKI